MAIAAEASAGQGLEKYEWRGMAAIRNIRKKERER